MSRRYRCKECGQIFCETEGEVEEAPDDYRNPNYFGCPNCCSKNYRPIDSSSGQLFCIQSAGGVQV